MSMQDTTALRKPLSGLSDVSVPADAASVPADAASVPAPFTQQTIRDCVESAMRNYLGHLDGCDVNNIYEMVLAEVEVPLLEVILHHVRYNQSRASAMLGLNRGTLRKKMKQYGML